MLKNNYCYNLFQEAKENSKNIWRILNEITGYNVYIMTQLRVK